MGEATVASSIASESSVIVGGARTPIGKLSGAFASLSATDLGGMAIAAALQRSGVSPEQVDHVVMGHVLQAGQGQITARQAAVKAGIPMDVPATVINKVCLSGLNAIQQANRMIRCGEADIVVAGGMESMTNAPYLLPGARAGYRLGDQTVVDALNHDGLFCAFEHRSMGLATDEHSADPTIAGEPISRAAMDHVAAQSHARAEAARQEGRFAAEIVAVSVPQRRGEPVLIDTDEGVRPGVSEEQLGALRPAFVADGTVTAGNASQISDGASAVVVMSPAKAAELGVSALGQIVSFGEFAADPSLLTKPSGAARIALERAGLAVGDIDLWEINEAFAAVSVASMGDLGISEDIVNVNGGAIALGHPIGASGNRLIVTLLHELARRGASYGVAALCGGGGQGDAMVVRSLG